MLVITCLISFFFSSSGDHRDLHSFPTRRSSDLSSSRSARGRSATPPRRSRRVAEHPSRLAPSFKADAFPLSCFDRSEEHTSELQSQSNLVCRLLLEKKKKNKKKKRIQTKIIKYQ